MRRISFRASAPGVTAFARLAFVTDRDDGNGTRRGLAFVGKYAVIGLSLARENRTFQGLGLERALAAKESSARCGLIVVDIETGDIVEWVRIEGVVRELFDVAVLPGVSCPSAIGMKGNEVLRVVSVDGQVG